MTTLRLSVLFALLVGCDCDRVESSALLTLAVDTDSKAELVKGNSSDYPGAAGAGNWQPDRQHLPQQWQTTPDFPIMGRYGPIPNMGTRLQNWNHLQAVANNAGCLVEDLVPRKEEVFKLSRKRIDHHEGWLGHKLVTDYKWVLDEIHWTQMDSKMLVSQTIVTMKGPWVRGYMGHQELHVTDEAHKEIFHIYNENHAWTLKHLLSTGWLFRILPAGSTNPDDAFFTVIKKDGAWFVYRGRKKDNNVIYHVDGERGVKPLNFYKGSMQQGEMVASADKYLIDVTVQAGGDTVLIICVCMIIDMADEL
eukprot:gnl/TRDRNA2_/TRDRNA2_40648_c0_seq1.p1 gnl/TRDRNA2_/TRDRNA2_40648_c0~~gnl/TRDRNA2_/TRDRNA2_40648_c0_seq1.p1  ORF type:complete len:307 (+),score=39.44 gnl/TRDRNA2_/TRDRNA2_40648_c0_seq1:90-1010(+)